MPLFKYMMTYTYHDNRQNYHEDQRIQTKNLREHKRYELLSSLHNYEEFHIKLILDVIREGKFRWLGLVMRREPHSMLREVVN